MELGDLLGVLQNEAELTNQDFIDFCKQICSGMAYLHSQNILHRDLACRNILVSNKNNSYLIKVFYFHFFKKSKKKKISDFGMSRKSADYYKTKDKKVFFLKKKY